MLNSIGLANPGRERFLAETLPRLPNARRADLGLGRRLLRGRVRRDLRRARGRRRSSSTSRARTSTRRRSPPPRSSPPAARRPTLPLYAKLSPAALGRRRGRPGRRGRRRRRALARQHDPRPEARRADAAPDARPGAGGYSGPALKPIALAAVYACRRATELPIVGMGGVATGGDVLELIACGATHVALGTVLFADPGAPARIRAELEAELSLGPVRKPGGRICAAHTNRRCRNRQR